MNDSGKGGKGVNGQSAAAGARPAVLRAYEIAKSVNQQPGIRDDKARAVLFGQDRNTVK